MLETLSPEEHQRSVMQIGDAVLKLHQYFLAIRKSPPMAKKPSACEVLILVANPLLTLEVFF